MKKIFITTFLAIMIAMLVVASASAQKGKVNIKGKVVAIDGDTLIVETNKGETLTVTVPTEFNMSTVQVGTSVLIKGETAQDDSIEADSIKVVGKPDNDNKKNEKDEKPEGFKDNSAFCAADKQDKLHPLAAKMAERYNVTKEWVMERICNGYSIGAIMLAVKTSQMPDINADADSILANRANGNGWGLIWKDLGLIGSEKNGNSPPGLLKKPEKSKNK